MTGSEVSLWFGRKFEFDADLALHPNLRARLAGTPDRLEGLVRDLSIETLTASPGGGWSIQEQVGHLGDLDALCLARLDDFDQCVETLTAADLTNAVTTNARHNDRPLPELLARFRDSRSEVMGRLDGLETADYARTALHPRLQQPMRLFDHLVFFAEHDDHHLARIREIVRAGTVAS